ncbi:hypothetical protein NE704_10145 [[Ruminococcus] gnavus]|uniref:hypothetical protein n=1 Tax=Mediterraneibacter gnavus TaxID=33038 RepID=UPI00210E9A6E|nr:hypothetical protein [Mediterraneibacter gnavus]MCQ4701355.1 hypothetical protein [Mediterraneibacter gnavus]
MIKSGFLSPDYWCNTVRNIQRGKLKVQLLGREFAWLDTGNPDALMEAANYIAIIQKRQGLYVSCIEEIAYKRSFIDAEQ